jgi:hypothetical protein
MIIFHIAIWVYFIFSYPTRSDQQKHQIEGHLFTFQGKDFVTENLGTTFPQTQVVWKRPQDRKGLCFSNQIGECEKYIVLYVPKVGDKGQVIFSNAEVVSPGDDPQFKKQFYGDMLKGPKPSQR